MEAREKHISVLTACYNEEENVAELIKAVVKIFESFPQYEYEHVFIDNCSTDNTVDILKEIANNNKRVKIIVNARNFGHIRSPFHGLIQCNGDAVISLVADFQDPPEIIKDFLQKWEDGYKIVIGIKNKSEENVFIYQVRKFYYNLLAKVADSEQIKNL